MWYRKLEDEERLKKLAENSGGGYPMPVYYNEHKGRYIRLWKSEGKRSAWAIIKRVSRRRIRCRSNRLGYYSKKLDDLWWNFW